MRIIIKARKYLNKKSLVNLYHSFVFPYLTYCIEIWGNASDIHLDALIKIKKKIVRIISNSAFLAHTDELFKEFNILPVHKLKLQRICLQMFKYNNNTLPESISELFVPYTAIHIYNTRNKHNLRPKQSNRAYMYKNFSFIGVHIWNDIQKHINVSVSYSAFKQLTRTYYLYNNPKYLIT